MKQTEAKQKVLEAIQQFLKDEVEKILNDHTSKPSEFKSAKKIVSYWSRANAAISGGGGIIPGPLGMVAAIPTLIMEIRNQICMLKDIATFYGKENQLDKNLTLMILFYASGNAGGKFIVFRGAEVLLAKASPKIIQKLLVKLSITLSQKAIGRFLAVWVPFLGPPALGAWSYATSSTIGSYAIGVFSKEINIVETQDDSEFDNDVKIPSEDDLYRVSINTCKAMIEMMYADYFSSDEEMLVVRNSIAEIVKTMPELEAQHDFTETINHYMIKYRNTRISDVDFKVFEDNEEHKLNLISLLIAVAKASDGVLIEELNYIEMVCTNIGYDYKTVIVTMLSI